MTLPSAAVAPIVSAQARLGTRGQRIAAGRLAGLGAAEFEHVPAGRLAAEVVIKGDDAVHLGAGDVQRLGDQRLGSLVDVAELVLQSVQNRQQRAFAIEVLANAGEARRPCPRGPGAMAAAFLMSS